MLRLQRVFSSIRTKMQSIIKQKITSEFSPVVLQIHNDSYKHSGHEPMRNNPSSETHFRLLLVSSKFANKSKPMRHRMVYKVLADELAQENGIHALQLTTQTPEEYTKTKEL